MSEELAYADANLAEIARLRRQRALAAEALLSRAESSAPAHS